MHRTRSILGSAGLAALSLLWHAPAAAASSEAHASPFEAASLRVPETPPDRLLEAGLRAAGVAPSTPCSFVVFIWIQ
jgi:hypothetical protein